MDAYDRSSAIEHATMTRVAEIYYGALKKALKNKASFLQKIKDLESGKLAPPKYYVDTGQVEKWKQGFYRELIRQNAVIDGITEELNAAGVEASELIRGSMVDIYQVNREEATEALSEASQASGVKVSFAQYDKRQIAVLLQEQESPFSKLAYDNLGRNPVIRRRLQNELAQATILGESQAKIIKRIRDVTGQTVAQARRVAQTERTRVQSQARWQAGQEAKEMGVGVYNEWSTRMIRSRDTHISLNGKKAMQGDPFVTSEGNELLYPGDPSAPAREVINCHCVLVPDVLLPGERLDANGNIVNKSELHSGRYDGIMDWDSAVFTEGKPLEWHYNKHKKEFPGYTDSGYLSVARWMMKQQLSDGVMEEFVRSDGSVARYYFRDNIFVATTNDGKFRTLMKPKDKEAYWRYEFERNQ